MGSLDFTYDERDLEEGTCSSCGEFSSEIVKGDGRCVGCFEEQRFYDMTVDMVSSGSVVSGYCHRCGSSFEDCYCDEVFED